MFSALGRLIRVTFATVTAAGVAAYIVFRLGLEHATNAAHRDDDAMISVAIWLWQGMSLSLAATLLMTFAIIVIGEVARIRSALFYIAGGGAAIAAAPLFSQLPFATTSPQSTANEWFVVTLQVCATAGFAAGLVYWLLAGRKA
jgi:hypothetical protein